MSERHPHLCNGHLEHQLRKRPHGRLATTRPARTPCAVLLRVAAPGGGTLASVPHIVHHFGTATQEVSIYYDGVSLQAGKTVKSVTLP